MSAPAILDEVLDAVTFMAADEAVGQLLLDPDEELIWRELGDPRVAELDRVREEAAAMARATAMAELRPWLAGDRPLLVATCFRPEPDPADDLPEVIGGRRFHRVGPNALVLWVMAHAERTLELHGELARRVARLAVQAAGDPEAVAGILDAEQVAWWAAIGVRAQVVDPERADAWMRRVPRPVRLLAVLGQGRFEEEVQDL